MKRDIYKIKKQYFELVKSYEKLGENMVVALKMLLDEAKIKYMGVTYRIKSFDSFLKKMDRKHCDDPFNRITDICGVRVICYYRSDIEKISEVINKEFKVIETEDKEELLDEDQFGYRSVHYMISIKDEWLAVPNYKGLAGLKAEVQVRTNLMHTWAEIEHKLEYKNDDDIPTKFKRKFSRISAQLEMADEQFDELRQEITNYRNEVLKSTMSEKPTVEDDEVNMDTLQVFLNYYFPNYDKSTRLATSLVQDMTSLGIRFRDLKRFYDEKSETLEKIVEQVLENSDDNSFKWYQVSSVITLLELCSPEYVEKFGIRKGMEEIIKKYI